MNPLVRTTCIFIFFAMIVAYEPQPQRAQSTNAPRCELITRALSDYGQIKIGDRRKDLERRFRHGGGVQFPSTTRYTYVDSEFLHVDIEYQSDPSAQAFSPNDVITRKSKLYIDYEPKD